MTDELTPEEKEAIDLLPRERMPAGLEERVVDAMRQRGFLARRRRTIVLSGGRAAGLLAACVALMIGAYSIGLHRGDGGRVIPAVETAKLDDSRRADGPVARAPEGKAERLELGKARAKDVAREAEERTPGRTQESKSESDAPTAPAAPAQPGEEAEGRVAQGDARQGAPSTSGKEVAESAPTETPAPTAALKESTARMQALDDSAVPGASNRPRTFMVNGSLMIVEAPDSVRVTQDEQGRMLLIYTSDGVIRIRLAGND